MSVIRCRLATVDDIPDLEHMRRPDTEAGPADSRMSRYLIGEHHPRDALAERVIVLAHVDDAPIGYAGGHRTARYGCDGELQYLYVSPAHRRAGVATALLQRLAQWCAERVIHRVCVDVVPENARARAFYTRSGAGVLNPNWMVWPDLPAAFGISGPDSL